MARLTPGELPLQRLFSTFAEGWPGFGLLLQRALTSIVLICCWGVHLQQSIGLAPSLPHSIGAVAGIFLFFGLWTPLAGIAAAVVELWTLFAGSRDPLFEVTVASLGATLAMIGPGVWSIDAHLYGRKHIEPSPRN